MSGSPFTINDVWPSRKFTPRMLGMVAVLIIVIFGCVTCYWGFSAPSSFNLHYRFLEIAFHTGAIGLTVILFGVILGCFVLMSQKICRRTISIEFADGTSVELDGVEHMRDNLAQILTAVTLKSSSGPTVMSLNDNSFSLHDRNADREG